MSIGVDGEQFHGSGRQARNDQRRLHDGVTGAYIGVINNGALTPEGPVLVTDTSATGAITSYTGTQPTAPASGIPAP